MRIFGRSSALSNVFVSLKESLPTKPGVKALSQKLPSTFSTLTTFQNNKGIKSHLGFRVDSTPLKNINEKWKNSFKEIKAKGTSRQSSSASNKDRRELQARVSDVLGHARKLEAFADKLRRDINENEKNLSLNERKKLMPEMYAIYEGLVAESKSAKSKLYKGMQNNGCSLQREGLSHGAGLSKKDYDDMIKGFDKINLSMQSKLRFAEQKIANMKRDLT
jgi:hypothetical protein